MGGMDDWLLPVVLVLALGLFIWLIVRIEISLPQDGQSQAAVPPDDPVESESKPDSGPDYPATPPPYRDSDRRLGGPTTVHDGVHDFFAALGTREASLLLAGFSRSYAEDWHRWRAQIASDELTSWASVEIFQQTLQKWQAVRPAAVRPTQDLQMLIKLASPHTEALSSIDIRAFSLPTPGPKSAVRHLWDLLQHGLASGRPASEVGITKALMLLTMGRLGPALDSNARHALGLGRVASADELLSVYAEIAQEVVALEDRLGCNLADLAPGWAGPVEVGRALDMMMGPRETRLLKGPASAPARGAQRAPTADTTSGDHRKDSSGRPEASLLEETLRQLVERELAEPTVIRACRSKFTAHYDRRWRQIHVSNLAQQPWLLIDALEVALLLIDSHGRVPKGKAMSAKLGDDDLSLETIEGAIAHRVYGRQVGESVFRRITPVAGLLVHLGLARDDCKSGYLEVAAPTR